ncbi:hypothetical protein SmJEL517_g02885 [Synchytrium microbalum]|uniref:Deleted in lung and esophageal cancer protein 1 Ig-like domain-containing protein n=1 Tax=Synchytrium microbalum TaxID=1806994 RepID=A0A507C8Z8_9FUNG|nr:uncharacterized protein SmJEL517_g02885 [Synchytrium microbalum]TPX34466.1 hypothetical protein SmJEL517_g02885 [Synchytrium microbalum]
MEPSTTPVPKSPGILKSSRPISSEPSPRPLARKSSLPPTTNKNASTKKSLGVAEKKKLTPIPPSTATKSVKGSKKPVTKRVVVDADESSILQEQEHRPLLQSDLISVQELKLSDLIQSMLGTAAGLKQVLDTEHERALRLREAELAKAKKLAKKRGYSVPLRESVTEIPTPAEPLQDGTTEESKADASAYPDQSDLPAPPPLPATIQPPEPKSIGRMEKIVKQRDDKVTDLRKLKEEILDAWKRAHEDESVRQTEGVALFGEGFRQLSIHDVPTLLQVDNDSMKQNSLVPFVEVRDIEDSPSRQTSQASLSSHEIIAADGRMPPAPGRKARQTAAVAPRAHMNSTTGKLIPSTNPFLRNPRLQEMTPSIAPSADGLSDIDSNSTWPQSKKQHPYLSATPDCILFSEYEAGNTFSQVVSFRNVGRHPARMRVTLSSSNELFVVEPIQPPAIALGLVAPGMSISYKVTFHPDSLADSEASLVVNSEGNPYTLSVLLRARRTRPSLTIPDCLACGPCRAGLTITRQWKFENSGGSGNFVFLGPGDNISLADTEFGESAGGISKTGPFEISPRRFKLNAGQSGSVNVKYKPGALDGSHPSREDFVLMRLACDNGHVLVLPITGTVESALVSVVRIVDIRGTRVKNSQLDQNGYHSTCFGNQNVGATTTRLVTIANRTKLKLPFQWHIHDEVTRMEHGAAPSNNGETPFYVFPTEGILRPESETTFECKFAPGALGECEGFAQMILPRSDRSRPDVALGLRCAGVAVPFRVHSRPAILQPPTCIYVGDSWECNVRIFNDSASEAPFEFQVENIDPNMLRVVVPEINGFVQAGTSLPINIELVGRFPGAVHGRLLCSIAGRHGPVLSIPIRAKVEFPPGQVEFREVACDFGLMPLGTSSTMYPMLANESDERMYFDAFIPNGSTTYTVSPSEGWLDPQSAVAFAVDCKPPTPASVTQILETRLMSECGVSTAGASIRLASTCTTPSVVFEGSSSMYFQCFLEIMTSTTITLRNSSPLPATIRWDSFKSDSAYINTVPSVVTIAPNDVVDVSVNATFYKSGESESVMMHGFVDGALSENRELKYEVSAYVSGICVEIALDNQDTADEALRKLEVNFDATLFETQSRTLTIRNTSPIRSEYNINVNQYTTPSESSDKSEDEQHPGLLVASTKEGPGFASAAGQAYLQRARGTRDSVAKARKMLQAGRGAAFKVIPSSGVIEPYESLTLELQAFNNLVGNYKDSLLIQIGEWINMTVPMSLSVVGSPIIVSGPHLAARCNSDIDWLPFGTNAILPRSITTADQAGCTRVLTIENVGPRDVAVFWKIPSSSPFSVDANPTHVPSYRPIKVKIRFASEVTGTFDEIIQANCLYIQPNGSRSPWPDVKNPGNQEVAVLLKVTGKAVTPNVSLEALEDRIMIDPATLKSHVCKLVNRGEARTCFTLRAEPEPYFSVSTSNGTMIGTDSSSSNMTRPTTRSTNMMVSQELLSDCIQLGVGESFPFSVNFTSYEHQVEGGLLKIEHSSGIVQEIVIAFEGH